MALGRFSFGLFVSAAFFASYANAEPPTRSEALQIARSFAEHQWEAEPKNVLHGPDKAGVEVRTPNRENDATEAAPGLWEVGRGNVGVPYKWGGFDTIDSFDAGIRAGKAAGDLYNSEKRRRGGDAVSSQAVGIDCSGFISRCWRLDDKRGTSTLPGICRRLTSTAELRPGDIMNAAGGHVILFAGWLDDTKTRARFYEAEPFSKVIASERVLSDLAAAGFQPLRYRKIRE